MQGVHAAALRTNAWGARTRAPRTLLAPALAPPSATHGTQLLDEQRRAGGNEALVVLWQLAPQHHQLLDGQLPVPVAPLQQALTRGARLVAVLPWRTGEGRPTGWCASGPAPLHKQPARVATPCGG